MLVTHAHADHIGLVGRIREASGALVGMHEAEAAVLRRGGETGGRKTADWLRARGASREEQAEILGLMARGRERDASLAQPDFSIGHGELPLGAGSSLRAVWTPGHTPGHLCFYDERQEVLLTGDHVLPRITPHIGLGPGATGDQLGDFLSSLRELTEYEPREVLPAHEFRFADLGARIEGLLQPSPDQAGGDRARRVEQSRPVDLGRRGRAALVPQLGADHGHVAPGRGQRDLGPPLPSAGPRPGDRSRTRPRFLAAGPPLFRPGLTSPQWFDTVAFDTERV